MLDTNKVDFLKDLSLSKNKMQSKYDNKNERDELIENYKDIIPDIKEYCEFKAKGKVNFNFINKDIKESLISNRIRKLFFSIVDIRNNNSPTSTESNAIVKTDNKFSNETKKYVRILLSKGLTANEIGYDMINLYGYSALCSTMYQENIPIIDICKYSFCLLSEAAFILLGLQFTVKKMIKLIGRRI